MDRSLLLRLHRWTTLVFALPLLLVIATGLILSFEPMLQHASIRPASLTQERLTGLLQQYDPQGRASGLAINPAERRLTINMPGQPPVALDLATGAPASSGPGFVSRLFGESRRLHERLLFGLEPLVPASSAAMLILAGLGVLMGWPRLTNDLYGWHKGVAWGLLPLLVVSPLTGLFMTFNLTFTPPLPRGGGVPLLETVRMAAAVTDPSNILFIAQRGGRQMVRTMEDGAVRAYAVTPQGLRPMDNNWPRLIHEGNWSGIWSGLLNAVTAVGMLALLVTGIVIWARRRFRRRPARRAPPGVARKQAEPVQ